MDFFTYKILAVRSGPIAGWGLAVESRYGVYALRLNLRNREDARRWIARNCPGARPGKTRLLDSVAASVLSYLRGEKAADFNCPLDFSGYTGFQKRVLAETRKIPYGRTTTYSRLAAQAGAPRAFRAVGQALGANRLLLLIPCHRVIRADGGLGGFSAPGGAAIKAWFLKLERSQDLGLLGTGKTGGETVCPARMP